MHAGISHRARLARPQALEELVNLVTTQAALRGWNQVEATGGRFYSQAGPGQLSN